MIINVAPGASDFYLLESGDGTESFLLDVQYGRRNPAKARFQLRYERESVLARLCNSVPHTNPDGTAIGAPHFHRYREGFGDRIAQEVEPFGDLQGALKFFCEQIDLPAPQTQGGIS
jgi:hypothetical protein